MGSFEIGERGVYYPYPPDVDGLAYSLAGQTLEIAAYTPATDDAPATVSAHVPAFTTIGPGGDTVTLEITFEGRVF